MGMGRKRSSENSDLPDNLYLASRGRFRYINPLNGKVAYWSTTRQKAKEAARKLNRILEPQGSDIIAATLGHGHKVGEAVEVFRRDDLALRKVKPSTLSILNTRVARIEEDLADRYVQHITVKDCAEYLNAVTDSQEARNRFRAILIDILNCAVQEGWIEVNPAASTRRVRSSNIKKKRERLSKEGYNAVYECAPAWLQNAMALSLTTLLRRCDVVGLRFDDYKDSKLHVVPQKTDESTLVRLRIKVEESLIARCRDDVVSPYIIHQLPTKLKPRDKWPVERSHHTQILGDQLRQAFNKARDKSGFYEGIINPPTFHEIRSLGGKLLMDRGWTLEQVQQLMGHASEEMTKVYLEGHEMPWVDVETGL